MEQTWLPQAVLDADWSIPKTFFESESVWSNEPNLVGSIYGRPSIKIAHLVPIR
jgi:hypothetical protein